MTTHTVIPTNLQAIRRNRADVSPVFSGAQISDTQTTTADGRRGSCDVQGEAMGVQQIFTEAVFKKKSSKGMILILLMAEILHQLIW